MNLTLEERETIITFNERDDAAECFTYNGKLARRLRELCESRPEECTHTGENQHGGQFFTFPKAWVKVNPPRTVAPLSEKEKQARRDTLARINSERRNPTSTTSGKF